MNTDTLDRCYDALDPKERVRLVIKAVARGDQREIDRLWKAAPRRTYTQIDTKITGCFNAMAILSAFIGLDLLNASESVERFAVLEVALERFQAAAGDLAERIWREAFETGRESIKHGVSSGEWPPLPKSHLVSIRLLFLVEVVQRVQEVEQSRASSLWSLLREILREELSMSPKEPLRALFGENAYAKIESLVGGDGTNCELTDGQTELREAMRLVWNKVAEGV